MEKQEQAKPINYNREKILCLHREDAGLKRTMQGREFRNRDVTDLLTELRMLGYITQHRDILDHTEQ